MSPAPEDHAPSGQRHRQPPDDVAVGCASDGAAPKGSSPRAELGRRGEELTAAHLETEGWQILDRNWRPGPAVEGQPLLRGELDLIALDPDGALVVVEVKTRRTERYGPPAAAVGPGKLRRLRLLAAAWARSHEAAASRHLRLDVVSVLLPSGCVPTLRHHRGVGL